LPLSSRAGRITVAERVGLGMNVYAIRPMYGGPSNG
jgi:hypothetical protein